MTPEERKAYLLNLVEKGIDEQFSTSRIVMGHANLTIYQQYLMFCEGFKRLTEKMREDAKERRDQPGLGPNQYLASEEYISLTDASTGFKQFMHDWLVEHHDLWTKAEDQRRDDDRQRTLDLKGHL